MRKRVTYRPGKAQGAFGTIWGGIFVLIGLFVVIPTFGPFGIIWTLGALGITVINALHAFGKKYVGPEIRIEEDKEGEPVPSDESHDHIQSTALNARERLEQLKTLREAGLITQQEYDQKRREIVDYENCYHLHGRSLLRQSRTGGLGGNPDVRPPQKGDVRGRGPYHQ